jgi:hypothetical protein
VRSHDLPLTRPVGAGGLNQGGTRRLGAIRTPLSDNGGNPAQSKNLLAPYTNGPRDVSRCGALSLLQKYSPRGGFSRAFSYRENSTQAKKND